MKKIYIIGIIVQETFLFAFLQEGKQASLAADFSISQFSHLGRLLLVHGRNRYRFDLEYNM